MKWPQPGEWTRAAHHLRDDQCPPDLKVRSDVRRCRVRNDYICTRVAGHTGRHAASNGIVIVAVWL